MSMTKTKRRRTDDRTVTLPRSEYERLLAKAGEGVAGDGPALPKPDARGNFPAVEYIRVSIARELIRRRRGAGLSQTALAELSGVRQETISSIETGKHTVTEAVMAKIEGALERSERRRRAQTTRRRSA